MSISYANSSLSIKAWKQTPDTLSHPNPNRTLTDSGIPPSHRWDGIHHLYSPGLGRGETQSTPPVEHPLISSDSPGSTTASNPSPSRPSRECLLCRRRHPCESKGASAPHHNRDRWGLLLSRDRIFEDRPAHTNTDGSPVSW